MNTVDTVAIGLQDQNADQTKNESKEKPEIYYTMLKYFARLTQFLAWPITFLFFKIFYKLEINGVENIRKMKSPFILISNHISYYDSFVFRLVLGLIPRNLPLRFMAVNSFRAWYMNFLSTVFITDIIYAIFGAFVVVQGRGIDKNLEDAVRIIKNKGNVVIYPEGSIIDDGHVAEFKLGAAVLAKKTKAVVIPVAMKIVSVPYRDKFVINVGESIAYDPTLTAEQITETFRSTVVGLHKK